MTILFFVFFTKVVWINISTYGLNLKVNEIFLIKKRKLNKNIEWYMWGGDNIKKYPIVVQDETKDCGVACIQMVINYYGGHVKKSKLLEMTKTNTKGTTAYNIKNTLINLGFDVKGIISHSAQKGKCFCKTQPMVCFRRL